MFLDALTAINLTHHAIAHLRKKEFEIEHLVANTRAIMTMTGGTTI
jgi:hypothetical protein